MPVTFKFDYSGVPPVKKRKKKKPEHVPTIKDVQKNEEEDNAMIDDNNENNEDKKEYNNGMCLDDKGCLPPPPNGYQPVELSRKHYHDSDRDILFVEKTHTYSVRFERGGQFEKKNLKSVSGVVKGYFKPFNKEKMAERTARSRVAATIKRYTKTCYALPSEEELKSYQENKKECEFKITTCAESGKLIKTYKHRMSAEEIKAMWDKNTAADRGTRFPLRGRVCIQRVQHHAAPGVHAGCGSLPVDQVVQQRVQTCGVRVLQDRKKVLHGQVQ